MPIHTKEVIFDNLDSLPEEIKKLQEDRAAYPEKHRERATEISEAKSEFLPRLVNLPLNMLLPIDYLVTDVFQLRMEEGLKELLDDYAVWKKIDSGIFISSLKNIPENYQILLDPESGGEADKTLTQDQLELYKILPSGLQHYPRNPTKTFLELEQLGYLKITEIPTTGSKYYRKIK